MRVCVCWCVCVRGCACVYFSVCELLLTHKARRISAARCRVGKSIVRRTRAPGKRQAVCRLRVRGHKIAQKCACACELPELGHFYTHTNGRNSRAGAGGGYIINGWHISHTHAPHSRAPCRHISRCDPKVRVIDCTHTHTQTARRAKKMCVDAHHLLIIYSFVSRARFLCAGKTNSVMVFLSPSGGDAILYLKINILYIYSVFVVCGNAV